MKTCPRTSWFLWGWAGLWVSMITCCGLTTAQAQDGPVLITKRQEIDKFGFTDIKATADLNFRYQRDKNTTNNTSTTTNNNKTDVTENNFRETFNLSANSYIIHPNLVDLTLGGSFGLTQSSVTRSDDNSNSSSNSLGTAQSYNLTATFLRKEFLPLTLFAQRSTNQTHSQFSGTTQNTTESYGANLSIRSLAFPTQLHLEHNTFTQDDPTDQRTFQATQDTFTWHSDYTPTKNQKLNLDYTFVDKNQTDSSANTYQSHDLIIHHKLEFGPDEHFNLNSNFNYFKQAGAFELQRWRLNEVLNMRHSDTFRTRARYSYNHEQRIANEQTAHRASAGFTHKLYKSLVTTGNIGLYFTDNGDQGTNFQKNADIQIAYNKQVPLGKLNINLSATFSQEDNSQQSSVANIFDEPHVYNDPLPITINRRNIIVGSIIVRNAASSTYIEGLDYTLDYFSDFVRLSVPLSSSINDGDTVLVTYITTSDPSNTTTSIGRGIHLRYAIERGFLKGLDLYASFYQQHQSISSSEPLSFQPDQITDITYGVDYKIWKLTFKARRRNHDSLTSPYQTTDFSANYRNRLSNRTSINLNTTYTTTNYLDQNNQTKNWRLSGQLNQQFSRNLYISVGATYRKGSNSLSGNTQAYEQTIELRWKRRQTNVYLTGRNAIATGDRQNTLSQILEIGINRTF